MNKIETIYYAGQGYIYRCPECNKVDRMPWPFLSVEDGNTANCRFCKKEFELDLKSSMTPDLYGVIQEINMLETGTVFGASLDMLEKDNLVRAGKSVGIDVLASVNHGKGKSDYFAPWRLSKDQLRELTKTEEGQEILAEVKKIVIGGDAFMDNDKPLAKEVWEEARLRVIMKKNKGLSNDEKIALLKKEGFTRDNHEVYINTDGKVTIFFSSTVAPECDYYMYWEN